jgi:hypothetical protein
MLGIVGFLSADKVAGSVPSLNDIAIPYDGNVMAPFIADGTSLALLGYPGYCCYCVISIVSLRNIRYGLQKSRID